MIEFQRIYKYYSPERLAGEALKGIDGTVGRGEVVALYGPSGSGKSSLLKICGLLDNDYKGRVIIGDRAITKTTEYCLSIRRKSLGYVMPGFDLIPAYTVFENVELPLLLKTVSKKKRLALVEEMLERCRIRCFASFKPEQLTAEIKLRVLVARALIHEPLAVIIDEPFSKIDMTNLLEAIAVIKQFAREFGCAVLVASNRISVAQACDRIIHLRNGHIVEHVPASIVQRSRISEALPWGS